MYTKYETYVVRQSDGACIPLDLENIDYVAFLEWVSAGNTPDSPPVLPPAIPTQVTMAQARLALLAAGKLPAVDAAISALASPQKEQAQIMWEYARTVDRDSPLMSVLGPALGLDSAALDALFTQAASL